jgi:siroheme synthase-like protein
MTRRCHPVVLDLEGRSCVVVGAGRVARPRIEALVEAGADVTVVAPDAGERVADLAGARAVRVVARAYEDGDLEGADLVVAATGDADVNARVHAEAVARRALVNVVDTLPLCGFTTPSVARRGDLTIAVSTAGRAPAVAALVRQAIEQQLDGGRTDGLGRARLWRRRILRSAADPARRRAAWQDLAMGIVPSLMPGALPRALPLPDALDDDLELPLAPPEAGAHGASRLHAAGTSILHATCATLERVAAVLDDAAAVDAILRGCEVDRADAVVVRDLERAEILAVSDRHDVATLLCRSLERAAALPSGTLAVEGFAASGGRAAAHVFAVAAGLRGLAAWDATAAASLPRRNDGVSADLEAILDAAASAGRDARAIAAPAREPDGLAALAAAFLDARLPRDRRVTVACSGRRAPAVARALASRGREARMIADMSACAELDVEGGTDLAVVLADHAPLDPRWLHGVADGGWRRVWVLDLSLPRAVVPPDRGRHGLTCWDLDTLAELTPLPPCRGADVPRARALLAERLESWSDGGARGDGAGAPVRGVGVTERNGSRDSDHAPEPAGRAPGGPSSTSSSPGRWETRRRASRCACHAPLSRIPKGPRP